MTLELVRPVDVDRERGGCVAYGELMVCRERARQMWRRIQDMRRRIKAEPLGGNRHGLRLELAVLQSSHSQTKLDERRALRSIERRANELGLTIGIDADGPV